jgi:hypothetical protein
MSGGHLVDTRITASGAIYASPCVLYGILVGTDSVNDPTVAAYNDSDGNTAANRVVPPTVIDASLLGFNGFFNTERGIDCRKALYVTVSGLGTGEVHIYWRPR